MGGGGLRILPHKKWHVWRRDNIERVLRDERENEEKQQALTVKERRLAQERRAQELLVFEGQKRQEHINFFRAEEAQAKRDITKHKKKNETDDMLRRHGRLPWYAQTEDAAKKEPTARQERKRKRELEAADPLQHMRLEERPRCAARKEETTRKRVFAIEGPAGSDRRKYSGRYDRSSTSLERDQHCSRYEHDEHRHSKKRKHHKEKKDKHKTSKEALLHELRRERDEREASERKRAEKLMYG